LSLKLLAAEFASIDDDNINPKNVKRTKIRNCFIILLKLKIPVKSN
jgi:hypothetical protein